MSPAAAAVASAEGRRRCGGCRGEPRVDDVDDEVDADVGGGAAGGGGEDVDATAADDIAVVDKVTDVVATAEAGQLRGLRQPSTAGPCELSSLDG